MSMLVPGHKKAELTPKPKSKEETTQKRQPYHVPLRFPVTHILPPKWAEKKKCFADLKEKLNHSPVKPKASPN